MNIYVCMYVHIYVFSVDCSIDIRWHKIALISLPARHNGQRDLHKRRTEIKRDLMTSKETHKRDP